LKKSLFGEVKRIKTITKQSKQKERMTVSLRSFMKFLPLIAATLAIASADYTPEALADEVKNLPGAEGLDFSFRQFSGYLSVTPTKHLHYWFTESSRSPEKDPVAFWTNGGKL
jgi:hypothetical protein